MRTLVAGLLILIIALNIFVWWTTKEEVEETAVCTSQKFQAPDANAAMIPALMKF